MTSIANYTLEFPISSTLVANVQLSTESFLLLSLSRRECRKAMLSAPSYLHHLFLIFINDLSDSLENPLYLFADDSTINFDIPQPFDRQAATTSTSSALDKITNWSNTWNMSFNPDKSHSLTHSLSPKGPYHKPSHLLSQQPSQRSSGIQIPWCHTQECFFLGKPHFKVGLQSQIPNGHPLSCKVLPWHA